MNLIHFQVQEVMQWSWIFLGPRRSIKVEFQKIKNCLGWNIGLEWLSQVGSRMGLYLNNQTKRATDN